MAEIHVVWDTLNNVGWDTMWCYVLRRETLGMFQKFREIFNGTPATSQKKSVRGHRPVKSAVLTSSENVAYIKRKQLKFDDAQEGKKHTRGKKHK